MRVAVVQAVAARGKPALSMKAYDALLSLLAADVVVLPELAFTGYDLTLDYASLAEGPGGETANWALFWAKKMDALFVVGAPIVGGGERMPANGVFIAYPDGTLLTYAKRHLWGDEGKVFERGREEPPVMEFRGAKVSVLICYDMTFPAEVARIAASDVDVVAIPSCWPVMTPEHAEAGPKLAEAVATQAVAAVAWADQVGHSVLRGENSSEGGRVELLAGNSLVTLPYGARKTVCTATEPGIAALDLDLERLREMRRKKFS